MFLGKIQHFKRKLVTVMKMNQADGSFDYYCSGKPFQDFGADPHNLLKIQGIAEKLFHEEIPPLMVKNVESLKISKLT